MVEGAVGAVGGEGAVGVEGEVPAELVDHDVMVCVAHLSEINQFCLAAARAPQHVVRLGVHCGPVAAAGPGAGPVADAEHPAQEYAEKIRAALKVT